MGIYVKGVFGAFSGKVGNVVGSSIVWVIVILQSE